MSYFLVKFPPLSLVLQLGRKGKSHENGADGGNEDAVRVVQLDVKTKVLVILLDLGIDGQADDDAEDCNNNNNSNNTEGGGVLIEALFNFC